VSKRGTTLIEAVAAIFIISVVLVTFLESLNIAITGNLELNRKTSALNLAKSQMDWVKANTSYSASTGNLINIYGDVTAGENISDIVNYNITGQVSNVSTYQGLQQISVNVSYLVGKQVLLTGYKSSDGTDVTRRTTGMRVTDNIPNVPTLPQGYGGFCLGSFRGYYHVFTTGTAGPVSMHWKFDWSAVSGGSVDIGCPIIAIYSGTPSWTLTDWQGEIRENAIIVRNQNGLWIADLAGIGDLPGPGNGATMCICCADAAESCAGESNPLYYKPTSHLPFLSGSWWLCLFGGYLVDHGYPCCGYSQAHEIFWSYDSGTSTSGTTEDTLVTGTLPAGTYTVLFFNAENMKNLDTVSASVCYLR